MSQNCFVWVKPNIFVTRSEVLKVKQIHKGVFLIGHNYVLCPSWQLRGPTDFWLVKWTDQKYHFHLTWSSPLSAFPHLPGDAANPADNPRPEEIPGICTALKVARDIHNYAILCWKKKIGLMNGILELFWTSRGQFLLVNTSSICRHNLAFWGGNSIDYTLFYSIPILSLSWVTLVSYFLICFKAVTFTIFFFSKPCLRPQSGFTSPSWTAF